MAKKVAAVLAGMMDLNVDPLLYSLGSQMKHQTALDALRGDWERVGGDLWKGVESEKAEHEARGLFVAVWSSTEEESTRIPRQLVTPTSTKCNDRIWIYRLLTDRICYRARHRPRICHRAQPSLAPSTAGLSLCHHTSSTTIEFFLAQLIASSRWVSWNRQPDKTTRHAALTACGETHVSAEVGEAPVRRGA